MSKKKQSDHLENDTNQSIDPLESVESPEQAVQESFEVPSHDAWETQLAAMEVKMNQYKDQAQRAQAELENVRRRAERDISNAHKFGSEKLLADLLPVVDSIIRGLDSPESGDAHAKAMRTGMTMTLDMLQKTLKNHGIELIDPKPGEPFDPKQHEAMSMLSDPDAEPNTIYEVVQKGFQLNGRVLRAAMVVVVS